MKPRALAALFSLAIVVCCPAAESAAKPPVLVSVHGAWAGGWQMKKVAPLLEAKGWKVYRPSLPGLGEHNHLVSPAIGLEEHIQDIVNLILFEDLHDVILLGHSYGGMVITGVADRIPDRIARLVYLDAFLPEDGESVLKGRMSGADWIEKMIKDGLIVPAWVTPDKPLPKDMPQPLKTFTDSVSLKNPARTKVPAAYILTVDPGKKPEEDSFFPFYVRAKERGVPVVIMEADHVPQWRLPEATAEVLLNLP